MDFLMDVGSASVEDIADHFSVSKMTIHRDLSHLENDRMLRKIHGGATLQSNSLFESDYQYRNRLAVVEKRAIAEAAAAKVEPGQAIILDDGTTIALMAEFLLERRPLTLITNNAAIIQEMMGVKGINLICPGGQYNKRFHGYFGLMTEQALQSLRANQIFISSSSISEGTAFHQDQEIVKTKRAIIASGDIRYLLVDHTKFDRTALHVLTKLSDFDCIITGGPISETARNWVEEAGTILEYAGMEK
jgi:DeoR/GlpR family transcriptional regulator of sugar metabolism